MPFTAAHARCYQQYARNYERRLSIRRLVTWESSHVSLKVEQGHILSPGLPLIIHGNDDS